LSTFRPGLTEAEVLQKLHRGLILEYISIGWMSIEGSASLIAGLLAGSLALVAFGGDSFIELLSAYAVAAYLSKRQKGTASPKLLEDTERITGVLLAALIPIMALGAVYSFLTGTRTEASIPGIAVAIGAVIIMPGLWRGKRRIGVETGCVPLSVDAVESATCFLMSIALLLGLLTVYLFGLWWVDYLAAGIILVFVAKEAVEAFAPGEDSPSR